MLLAYCMFIVTILSFYAWLQLNQNKESVPNGRSRSLKKSALLRTRISLNVRSKPMLLGFQPYARKTNAEVIWSSLPDLLGHFDCW